MTDSLNRSSSTALELLAVYFLPTSFSALQAGRQCTHIRRGRATTASGGLAKGFPLPLVTAPLVCWTEGGTFIDWGNRSGSCRVCEGAQTAALHPRREENMEFYSKSLKHWDRTRAITVGAGTSILSAVARHILPTHSRTLSAACGIKGNRSNHQVVMAIGLPLRGAPIPTCVRQTEFGHELRPGAAHDVQIIGSVVPLGTGKIKKTKTKGMSKTWKEKGGGGIIGVANDEGNSGGCE
jgi:hypothetical protein